LTAVERNACPPHPGPTAGARRRIKVQAEIAPGVDTVNVAMQVADAVMPQVRAIAHHAVHGSFDHTWILLVDGVVMHLAVVGRRYCCTLCQTTLTTNKRQIVADTFRPSEPFFLGTC
jgi:hypothetical protein